MSSSVFHSFEATLLIGREIMLFAAEIASLTKARSPAARSLGATWLTLSAVMLLWSRDCLTPLYIYTLVRL